MVILIRIFGARLYTCWLYGKCIVPSNAVTTTADGHNATAAASGQVSYLRTQRATDLTATSIGRGMYHQQPFACWGTHTKFGGVPILIKRSKTLSGEDFIIVFQFDWQLNIFINEAHKSDRGSDQLKCRTIASALYSDCVVELRTLLFWKSKPQRRSISSTL